MATLMYFNFMTFSSVGFLKFLMKLFLEFVLQLAKKDKLALKFIS